MTFTFFDIIIVSIIFISTLLGFYKGFLAIVINLISLICALLVAIFLYPHFETIFSLYVANKLILALMSALVAFLVSFLSFSFLASKILALLKENSNGIMDKSCGLVLGLVRGFLFSIIIFSLIVIFTSSKKVELNTAEKVEEIFNEEEYPNWLKISSTTPYLQKVTIIGYSYLPERVLNYFNPSDGEKVEEKDLINPLKIKHDKEKISDEILSQPDDE